MVFNIKYTSQFWGLILVGIGFFLVSSCKEASFTDEKPSTQRFPEGVSKASYKLRQADGSNFQGARIEPPNWWIGMAESTLEIMIYDQDIQGSKVSFSYPGVSLMETYEVENPNYLFLKLNISPSSKPGTLQITLTRGQDVRTYPYDLLARPQHHELAYKGLNGNDIMYLLMPDRFANGDSDNDEIEGMQQMGIDRSLMYFRHGGDLQGIINHLDYLTDLGVTALWINPVQENNQPYDSYHGYAITDHYNIDPRFGDNELYKTLVDSCHSRGIKVVMDIIHNHVGDQHFFINDLPDYDWIHQHDTFWKTTYRDQVLMDPYASEYDKNQMSNGWFDDHMPDLNQKHPRLATYLTQNNLWWVEFSGLNAYRIDTYAYPDQAYMADWGKSMQTHFPHLTLFAETWVHGSPNQAWFTADNQMRGNGNSHMPAVTDFQLYYAINEALSEEQGWTEGIARMYTTLSHDFLYEDPYRNVTFLDNHDLDRFFSRAGENKEKFKTGLNWLLTLRGVPMIYYGTEIQMKNFSHPDGLVREDFPGGWSDDPVSKFTKDGRSSSEQEAYAHIQKLIALRKQYQSLGSGKFTQYVPDEGRYIYFRYDNQDTIMVIANTHDRKTQVSTHRLGQFIDTNTTFVNLLNDREITLSDAMKLEPFESKIILLKK